MITRNWILDRKRKRFWINSKEGNLKFESFWTKLMKSQVLNCLKFKTIWFGICHLIWPVLNHQGTYVKMFVTYWKELCLNPISFFRLYAGSFWSHPYKAQAPKELLQNQEASLLRDIRDAINKRVENRISTARRFAVRIIIWLSILKVDFEVLNTNSFHEIFDNLNYGISSYSFHSKNSV